MKAAPLYLALFLSAITPPARAASAFAPSDLVASPSPASDTVASAIDLGVGMTAILGAFMHSRAADSNSLVMGAYRKASASARDLEMDLPMPPLCRAGLATGNSQLICPGGAEGLVYTISAIRNIREHLERRFGKRVSNAFMFSVSVLQAKAFGADDGLREQWLKHATEAAENLNLPMDDVTRIFRYTKPDGSVEDLLAELEKLKVRLRS